MGDIIDFKPKKKLDVEYTPEEDAQGLLEMAIVALFEHIKGVDMKEFLNETEYLLFFLQFSGMCFEYMEEDLIIVDEDGNLGISEELKKELENVVQNIKREFATSH